MNNELIQAVALMALIFVLIFAVIGAWMGVYKNRSVLGWTGIGVLCALLPYGLGIIMLILLGFLVPGKGTT